MQLIRCVGVSPPDIVVRLESGRLRGENTGKLFKPLVRVVDDASQDWRVPLP